MRIIRLNKKDKNAQEDIPLGDASQYYRGDKTWQSLTKTAVNLANADNTSDINKPVSTAQATADSVVEGKIGKSYNASGVEYGAFTMRRTANTNASGTARIYITDDGTSGGNAVYTLITADDVFPIPVGSLSNYQVTGVSLAANKKYVDVTVNQLGSVLLGIIQFTSAASGVPVRVIVSGK